MSLTLATRPHTRTSASDVPSSDPVRAWLARLPAELPAFATHPLVATDSRTIAEAHAAARAANCPDLFLVHVSDEHAGERILSDVARAAEGRVLILSPNPDAADRITERLAKAGVVRALAEDENPIRPSPVVAKLTSAALGAGRVVQLQREAEAAIAAAQAQHAALKVVEELALRHAELEADLADLHARREKAEEDARAATDRETVARTIRLRAAQENPQPNWMADVELLSTERQTKHDALSALRRSHVATAVKPGFFARLLGKAKTAAEESSVDPRERALEAEIDAIDSRLAAGQAEFDTRAGTEWERLVREKAAALLAQTDQRVAELTAARDNVRAEIEAAPRPFGSIVPPMNEWPALRAEADRMIAVAHNHLAELASPDVARRMLAAQRVVVGTPGSLHTDPVFVPAAPNEPPYDLLILDRCEDLTEPDFVRIAKLAARWVLVGNARWEPRPPSNGSRGGASQNGRHAEMPFAARMARMLERQTWVHEDERLVCRLAFPTQDERRTMTREPLLDRPEIELRFTVDASGEPVLAEVAFPTSTTAPAAKDFMFHQLGEVLLRPRGAVKWEQTPAAMCACWPAAASTEGEWIELESGVREKIVGAGLVAFTAAIAFDLAAGWDAEKAEAWLASHLPAESNCRYAFVPAEKSR